MIKLTGLTPNSLSANFSSHRPENTLVPFQGLTFDSMTMGDCELDGIITPCSMVMRSLGSGASNVLWVSDNRSLLSMIGITATFFPDSGRTPPPDPSKGPDDPDGPIKVATQQDGGYWSYTINETSWDLTQQQIGQKAIFNKEDQEKYDSERQRALKNLRENKKCRDFLEKILKGTGKTVEDLIDAVTLQRPFNGAKSTISRLDAGLVNREVDIGTEPGRAYAKGSVDNSFKGSGAYEAWTAFYVGPDRSIGLTVSDRSDVYFKSVHSAGYGTILHEALHSLLKASDLDLGKLFDVAVVPNQDTNGITEAIKNGGCNKR